MVWEMWLVRAMFCLFELIFLIICRMNLCEWASDVRTMMRYGRGRYTPQDTGRQPKWLVWLLYTDVRSIRNQDFALRLNMVLNILALPYAVSELALGWLTPTIWWRILLVLCAAFFGICTFISHCIRHKRDYGHAFILYARQSPGSKSESSIFDFIILCLQMAIAGCYWHI